MTIEQNKTLVKRFIDEVMNNGNTAAINDFCVPGSMFARGIKDQIKAMKTSLPDHQMTVDTIFAEGSKVAVRATSQGTNTGSLVGFPAFGRFDTPVPPTGSRVMSTEMYIFTVSDGKISSLAREIDQIGILR